MNATASVPDPREASNTHVHDLAKTGTKSCCVIARAMIKAGADPEEHVEFIRGKTPVFAPRPLKWWAERQVREADQNGPMRIVKIAPQEASGVPPET